MYSQAVRTAALALRKQGKMYKEINQELGLAIPKGTLSGWFEGDVLSDEVKAKFAASSHAHIFRVQKIAVERKRVLRAEYFKRIEEQNQKFRDALCDFVPAKVALAMLYLGEGAKNIKRGCVRFGNSDPEVISLFLRLFRQCYDIDESKLRGTVQCRADQNVEELRGFWSRVSDIPLTKFFKTHIDPRTIGKQTMKSDYKGVFVVTYLNAPVFHDLLVTGQIMKAGR